MFLARFVASLFIISPLMCSLQASAQAVPDVSGKWAGTLDIVHGDGHVDPDQAFFSLAVNNGVVSGSAGNSPDHQLPITTGKVTKDGLTFEIMLGPSKVVKFELIPDATHMHGVASGLPAGEGSKIVVDVHRADSSWHVTSAITHIPDRLFENIAALDKKLFDAYNHCDLPTMGALVADDLEFYHDKTGLSVGKSLFLESIRNNICGKTQRELIPGSMQVYRLDNYGAVEIGEHRFLHPGHEEIGIGVAKFITLWHFKDGNWQISREISYDHQAATQESAQTTSPR